MDASSQDLLSGLNSQNYYLDDFLKDDFIPQMIKTQDDILPKMNQFARYLFDLNSFSTAQEETVFPSHFEKISQNAYLSSENADFNDLYTTILSAFLDLIRLTMPRNIFSAEAIKYYLKTLLNWMNNLDLQKFSEEGFKGKFEHILELLAKTNFLFYFISTGEEKQAVSAIEAFFDIQEEIKYETSDYLFEALLDSICLIIEESKYETENIMGKILTYMDSKKTPQKFLLAKAVITKMQMRVSGIISNLLTKADELNIEGESYARVLKQVAKISNEFLIQFFLGIKDPSNLKVKVNEVKYSDLLLKIFSIENSLPLMQTYSKFFNSLIDHFPLNVDKYFNEGFRFLKCFSKFLFRNKKLKYQDENTQRLINLAKDKMNKFLAKLKKEDEINRVIVFIKKVPKVSVQNFLLSSLIQSKNEKASLKGMKTSFEIFSEKLFQKVSLYDFQSVDFIKKVIKYEDLFSRIFLKIKQEEKDVFQNQTLDDLSCYFQSPNAIGILISLFLMVVRNEGTRYYFFSFFTKCFYPTSQEKLPPINCLNIFKDAAEQKNALDFFINYLKNMDEESNVWSTYVLMAFINYMNCYVKIFTYEKVEMDFKTTHFPNLEVVLSFCREFLEQKIRNQKCGEFLMLLLKVMVATPCSDELKEKMKQFILQDVSNFVFTEETVSPTVFAFLILNLHESLGKVEQNQKSNEIIMEFDSSSFSFNGSPEIQTDCFPNDFMTFLDNYDCKRAIKFLNKLHHLDTKGVYQNIIFNEDIENKILREKKQRVDAEMKECETNVSMDARNENEIKRMEKAVAIHKDILKYKFYLLKSRCDIIQDEESKLNFLNYAVELLTDIYSYFETSYEDYRTNEEEDKKEDSKDGDAIQIDGGDAQIGKHKNKIVIQIQMKMIFNYISVFLKFIKEKFELPIKIQMAMTNICLCKEPEIKEKLLMKLAKIIKGKSFHVIYYMILFPMVSILFADPEKNIATKAKKLFYDYMNLIYGRLTTKVNLDTDEIEDKNYHYVPEMYISLLMSYIIFNPNLNYVYLTEGEKKFGKKIFDNYLKILCKVTSKKVDADFMLRIINRIKLKDLKEYASDTPFASKGLIYNISYAPEDINYEKVKNSLCEYVSTVVKDYLYMDFKYQNLAAKLPTIYSVELFGPNGEDIYDFKGRDTTVIKAPGNRGGRTDARNKNSRTANDQSMDLSFLNTTNQKNPNLNDSSVDQGDTSGFKNLSISRFNIPNNY
ncbi:MAG: hypothetical protein MJ252_14315 [archaeon]|nr:hypothetical protein [archaeon]